MAIEVFPIPVAEAADPSTTSFITMPDHKYYVVTKTYKAGTYELKMTAVGKTAKVEFFDANNTKITTVSLSGTTVVVLNLGTECVKARAYQPYVQSIAGTVNAQVEFKGATLTGNTFTGIVQTISSSQVVAINGTAYLIAIGGGGAGNIGRSYPRIGSGGGTGGVGEIFKTDWAGNYTITIGAGMARWTLAKSENTNTEFAGTTTVTGTGFTMSAFGGSNGHSRHDQNTGYNGDVTGNYDFKGGATGGWVHANSGDPYAFTYQHAKGGGVHSGSMGGISTGQTNMLNGRGGYGADVSTIDATGFGNSGAGMSYATGEELGGAGAPGVVYIITELQEV